MKRILSLLLAVLLVGAVLGGPTGTPSAEASPAVEPVSDESDERPVTSEVVLFGDSLSARARGKLRLLHPDWRLSAVRGRNVRRLPDLVAQHLDEHGAPGTLVVALGTNPDADWSRDSYRGVVQLLPAGTKVVFVTTYRDPEVFGVERSDMLRRYSRWMRQIAAERPGTCLVPWRSRVIRRPHLMVDGVHATPRGERVWTRLVSQGVGGCRSA